MKITSAWFSIGKMNWRFTQGKNTHLKSRVSLTKKKKEKKKKIILILFR